MERVEKIAYRYLTQAEFFNINKPPGTEAGGGGQAYIDFPTTAIAVEEWHSFFDGVEGTARTAQAQGPGWQFPMRSIGISGLVQTQKLYQRRQNSVSIASQKLDSRESNRVAAWHPRNGFPEGVDDRYYVPQGLVVFLAKTELGRVWAGWFLNTGPNSWPIVGNAPNALLPFLQGQEGSAGMISLAAEQRPFLIDSDAAHSLAFSAIEYAGAVVEEGVGLEADLLADLGPNQNLPPDVIERTVKVRARNQGAVAALKALYGGQCQVSGEKYSFLKKDGSPYSEGHHLVPLGSGGFDDPRNIIVVSPLIHRMLHYCKVEGLDLRRIVAQADGSAYLDFLINNAPFRVTWKPGHAERVLENEVP